MGDNSTKMFRQILAIFLNLSKNELTCSLKVLRDVLSTPTTLSVVLATVSVAFASGLTDTSDLVLISTPVVRVVGVSPITPSIAELISFLVAVAFKG